MLRLQAHRDSTRAAFSHLILATSVIAWVSAPPHLFSLFEQSGHRMGVQLLGIGWNSDVLVRLDLLTSIGTHPVWMMTSLLLITIGTAAVTLRTILGSSLMIACISSVESGHVRCRVSFLLLSPSKSRLGSSFKRRVGFTAHISLLAMRAHTQIPLMSRPVALESLLLSILRIRNCWDRVHHLKLVS